MDLKPKYRIGNRFREMNLMDGFFEIVGVSPNKGYDYLEPNMDDIPAEYIYFIEERDADKFIYDVVSEVYLDKCCKLIK